jgi:hypothetical protein
MESFTQILADTPLARRLARLQDAVEAADRIRAVVIVKHGAAPRIVGPLNAADRAAILAGLDGRDPVTGQHPDPHVVILTLREGMTEAVALLVGGTVREVCALGARGDGKTVGAAIGRLDYAAEHEARGGQLPVRVLVPTTAMTEHRIKLGPSLRDPLFGGVFRSYDDDHLWIATIGGVEYVHLILFGVNDPSEQDKLRQAAHALWVEEAAPAGVEAATGLTEDALGLGITSLRLPSYHHPVLVTSNYGSESHWSWQRYHVRQHPGTRLVRIAPGEWASAEDRAAWMQALDGRPDLQRRLVAGEPALIVAGEAVLAGVWNPELHVSREPLPVVRGARTMLGHDTGLRPATVVVQEVRGQLRVLAALTTDYGGMAQHIAGAVLPWLGRHGLLDGHAATLEHRIDPAGMVGDFGNSEESPERIIRRLLRGAVREGPVKWAPRIEPVLAVLGRMVSGQPALVVAPGPDTAVLREACAGRWFYPRRADGTIVRELPEKTHPHSDAGDALCYAVAALAPWRERSTDPGQRYAVTSSDVWGDRRRAEQQRYARTETARRP